MAKNFLYCRVSSVGQDLEAQREALCKAYPDGQVFEEKQSGVTMKGRTELETILKFVGQDDKLVVWKLDRLARNMMDLCGIVDHLKAKGASLEILDQKIDTSTASGNAFLQMLGVFAEFETNLRKERQELGIAKAKAEGRYKGKQVDQKKHDKALEYLRNGASVPDIMKVSGLGRSTVYRIKKANNL